MDILIYNHHDNWDLQADWQVEIEVTNLPFATDHLLLTHYRIDASQSNAYSEWVRQGKPMYPNAGQKQAITTREGLEMLVSPQLVPCDQGKVSLSIILPVHGISLLTLAPAR